LFLFNDLFNAPWASEAPSRCTKAQALRAFQQKLFTVEVSVPASSNIADAITTPRLLDRGGWENNPIFGRHPSLAKQAGINLGVFALQSGLFYLTEHNRHAWVRWAGGAFLAHSIADHAHAAACNAGLNPSLRVTQSCGPLIGAHWF